MKVWIVFCEWGGIPEICGVFDNEAAAEQLYRDVIEHNGRMIDETDDCDLGLADECEDDIETINGARFLRADEDYSYRIEEWEINAGATIM